MSEALIFIGPMETSEVEKTILRILGNAMAYMGVELVVSPRGEANQAVIKGVKEFGKEPVLKPGKLLGDKADAFLVYTDLEHDLIRTLDTALPTWRRNNPEPTIVQGPDELQDYVYATLAAIKLSEMQQGVINGAAPDTP